MRAALSAAGTRPDTVVDRIGELRIRTPHHPAIVDAHGTLELGRLWEAATALAARLARLPGFAPEDRIALLLPRDRSMPVAMLGSLLAGGAFLPLDPSWPADRLAFILADAGCRALVTARGMPEPDWKGPRLDIGADGGEGNDDADGAAGRPWRGPARPGPQTLAYVIYTSGSTGRPKGVLMEHGPLATLVAAVRGVLYRDGGAAYGETLTAPFVFDVVVQQIFSALSGDCSLHILPDRFRHDPEALLAYAARHRIAQINVVVSHLALLLESGLDRAAPWLRRIVTGGEALPLPLVRRLFADPALDRLELVNMYGPAENCVDSTSFVITAELARTLDRVPIGRALPGTRILILDEGGNPLPPGTTGEIALTGDALARGYLNRPDVTARAFRHLPPSGTPDGGCRLYRTGDLGRLGEDGLLEFRGRLDNQIKIAGQRVEIEEIEERLKGIDGVRDAAVLYRRRAHGGRLIAVVAAAEPPDSSRLRTAAARLLPAYMVPGAFIHAGPALPLTHNGKVDREALAAALPPEAEPGGAGNPDAGPRTVAALWAEVLGRADPNPAAGFLALGGDSIAAIRLVAGIRSRFRSDVPLEAVLANITLDALERLVEQGEGHAGLAPAPSGNDHATSSAQQRLWYLSQLPGGGPLYNVPVFRETGPLDPDRVRDTLRRLMARHAALRTALVARDGVLRQVTAEDPPFPFAVDDLSAHADPEAAAAAIAAAESRHPFDLAHAPLFRLRLLRMAADRWRFLLVLHHCQVDGWAISVLLEDFNILYGDPDAPLPDPRAYADFAHWEQTRDANADLEFWRAALSPPPPRIALPSAGVGEAGRGALARRTVAPELRRRVEELALRQAVTPAAVLLSHYAILLNRLTTQTDLCVGMGVANRPYGSFDRCVGCFVNVVPVRVRLAPEATPTDLYDQVGRQMREALSHQSLPLDVMAARFVPGGGPPFNVLFAWQSYEKVAEGRRSPVPVSVGGELERFDHSFGRAKFDLSLYAYPNGDALELVLEYDTAAVAPSHAERWLSALVDLTDRLAPAAMAGHAR
ncbi:non-ribosomal peptide synthetase [Azospirillum doebereinerae]|nr:non-ribosomal peptide synthetase [Azospirillum doebereinerae]MCG5239325.1 non-ribosomal peptide synthetase [Azospirillum doebereinerae]